VSASPPKMSSPGSAMLLERTSRSRPSAKRAGSEGGKVVSPPGEGIARGRKVAYTS
jgi:hypothetical protein